MNRFKLLSAVVAVLVADNVSLGRTWTDRQGRQVEADFVAFADGQVRVKRNRDGKVFDVPIESLSDVDQAFIKSQATNPGFLLQDAQVYLKAFGSEISNAYRESIPPNINVHLSPAEKHRLVMVQFRVTAKVTDPTAVDKLAERRIAVAAGIPIFGKLLLVDDGFRGDATGEYRFFDMADVRVIDARGEGHSPLWAAHQSGPHVLFAGGGITAGGGAQDEPWHGTYRTDKTYTGLLKLDMPALVRLIYSVPNSEDMGSLQLQIESQDPVALQVGQ